MEPRIDSIRERIERHLAALEGKVCGGTPLSGGFAGPFSGEKHRSEAEMLRRQLEERTAELESRDREARRQQEAVERLVQGWKRVLALAEQAKTEAMTAADDAAGVNGQLREENRFLRAEVASYAEKTEEFTHWRAEFERQLKAREEESRRLSAQLKRSEEEKAMLVREIGILQAAADVRSRAAEEPRPRRSFWTRTLRWLSRPMVEVTTDIR